MNAPLPERFELIRPLGASPHAETRLVRDRSTGRTGVLKSLDAARASDEKTLELFRREARVLGSLTHPNIPRLLEMIEQRTESTLVLHLLQEHAPGDNLEEVVRRRGLLPETEVIAVAGGLLDALDALHAVSPPVIHRDIKPSNVVLSDDGTVHLIDFSGARDRMMQDREPGGGGFTIIGTWGYMPYEQYEGRALPASDLYSLGMTLVFLATGKEPLDLDRDGMRLLIPGDAPVSKPLRAVLEWMIEPDWTRRPQSARDVRQALDRIRPETRARRQSRAALVSAVLVATLWICLTVVTAPPTKRVLIQTPKPSSASAPLAPAPARAAGEVSVPDIPPVQGAPIPERQEPDAVGIVSWAGRPFSERSSAIPKLRASTAGDAASFRIEGDTIQVWGLSPGKEIIFAVVGDGSAGYNGGSELFVHEGRQARFELSLNQRIRILAPTGSSPCREESRIAGPVRFEWEPVASEAKYDYDVISQPCAPGQKGRPVASGTVDSTHVLLDLPPSAPGSYYAVNLSARIRGTRAGQGSVGFAIKRDGS